MNELFIENYKFVDFDAIIASMSNRNVQELVNMLKNPIKFV